MREEIIEFTATGSPRVVSSAGRAIRHRAGSLNAIVIPWENDRVTLSTAVTSAKGQRSAIKQTNLGTIRLADLGNDMAGAAITSHDPDYMEKQQVEAFFEGFGCRERLQVTP